VTDQSYDKKNTKSGELLQQAVSREPLQVKSSFAFLKAPRPLTSLFKVINFLQFSQNNQFATRGVSDYVAN
jgi:hypothetical protein